VRVKRHDASVETVMLMTELPKFLDKAMPNAVHEYLAYPQSFEYNQKELRRIQGFPKEAQTLFAHSKQQGPKDREQKSREQWKKTALANLSEAKTFRALETLFQSRPSLMMSGVKAEKILQVARQSAKYSLTQSKRQNPHLFSVPLTKEERMLAEAFGFDLDHLEAQIKALIALTSSTLPPFATHILNRLDVRIHLEASKIYHTYTKH